MVLPGCKYKMVHPAEEKGHHFLHIVNSVSFHCVNKLISQFIVEAAPIYLCPVQKKIADEIRSQTLINRSHRLPASYFQRFAEDLRANSHRP